VHFCTPNTQISPYGLNLCTFAHQTLKSAPMDSTCALLHTKHSNQPLWTQLVHFCTPNTQISPFGLNLCTFAHQLLKSAPKEAICSLLHHNKSNEHLQDIWSTCTSSTLHPPPTNSKSALVLLQCSNQVQGTPNQPLCSLNAPITSK
jgi:hypothetical protein